MLSHQYHELRGLIEESRQAIQNASGFIDRIEAAICDLLPEGDPEKRREAERLKHSPSPRRID